MDAQQAAEPRVSISREEFDAILAAKDAEIDFERGLTDKARETIERLAAQVEELHAVISGVNGLSYSNLKADRDRLAAEVAELRRTRSGIGG